MNESTVKWLNGLDVATATDQFRKCCGAEAWIAAMVAQRPYEDGAALRSCAERCFDELTPEAWVSAFNSHPRIGDLNSLRMRLAGNNQWSAGEQAGMNTADETTIQRLADANKVYDERFGYPFIVCASGKTAVEMCEILYQRLENTPAAESPIAAEEQRKITRLRLEKLAPPVDAA